MPADADPLADPRRIDVRPDRGDRADDLVAGHERIGGERQSLSIIAMSLWQIPQWLTLTSTSCGPSGPGSYSNGSSGCFGGLGGVRLDAHALSLRGPSDEAPHVAATRRSL